MSGRAGGDGGSVRSETRQLRCCDSRSVLDVQLELVAPADRVVVEAIRSAVAEAGIGLGERLWSERGAWWGAGVLDAVERRPRAPAPGPRYEVALSPRSTRGARRA